ncbi:hypothetical protein [Rathayibacter sp. VKM Ac-2857]|uniref:hypothetical protein n=1 Tax=Rathayibacter sp. VKM Ac-2857 TaxID=2739020 RepID=UPI001563BF32|nr:hypothetical protein [Rathayibacter sp. VKM Ac-2857]NQX17356.1 hypothetical protein [Rathayibacter sp. VKM Ac-2857]
MKTNRRAGSAGLYISDPTAYTQYQAYVIHEDGKVLQPAGLVGPVTLRSVTQSSADRARFDTRWQQRRRRRARRRR